MSKCHAVEMDRMDRRNRLCLWFISRSFLFAWRYTIEWIPAESEIPCIFIALSRTTLFQRTPGSTGIWPNTLESTGIGTRRTHSTSICSSLCSSCVAGLFHRRSLTVKLAARLPGYSFLSGLIPRFSSRGRVLFGHTTTV
jgi:hypothetical protein